MSNVDQQNDRKLALKAKCIASVDAGSCEAESQCEPSRSVRSSGSSCREKDFFKSLQFTPDGTCVITHNEGQDLHTFVLPQDLLITEHQPHQLETFATSPSPTNIQSYAIYPGFTLSDATTTLILSSAADLPIQLRNGLDYSHLAASYPWVDPTTEAYLAANALAFVNGATQFVAGSKGRISVFDLHRSGESPVLTHKTGQRRELYGETNMQCSGLIMALAVSSEGLLAAGSSHRKLGLFSASGLGSCVTSFSLQPPAGRADECKGTGVTSLLWSTCERYLMVAERQSDCVQIFDVRRGGERLTWLSGRKASTTQRMGVEVVPTAEGFEIWAGGIDGVVRMWANPGKSQGEHVPDGEIEVGKSAIGGMAWHPQGIVMATCSGERSMMGAKSGESDHSTDDSGDSSDNDELDTPAEYESALRIWSMT